jgi:8-hydroxy-5-deazaflavin:NADPH oxidoreductase
MPSAVIGTGKIGTAVASHLAQAGEPVVLAARTPSQADQLAGQLGASASAASVADAIKQADAVILAVWFDPMKDLIAAHSAALAGKVVIDPSNPIAADGSGGFARTLPDGVSSGSVIAGLLPASAHFVKAFGTVSAEHLAEAANRTPDRAVLFYATDDDAAASTAQRLIAAAGFDPVKAGGLNHAIRIEVFGDLHDLGGLNGKLLTVAEAKALLASPRP